LYKEKGKERLQKFLCTYHTIFIWKDFGTDPLHDSHTETMEEEVRMGDTVTPYMILVQRDFRNKRLLCLYVKHIQKRFGEKDLNALWKFGMETMQEERIQKFSCSNRKFL